MGIQGLLKALKPYTEPIHVAKYAGKRVGIDAYSWLHKGAYACSREVCEQNSLAKAPSTPSPNLSQTSSISLDSSPSLTPSPYSSQSDPASQPSSSTTPSRQFAPEGHSKIRRGGTGHGHRSHPLYVQYFLHRIRMLKHHGVIPVVVFDGGRLPMKAATESERRKRREANLAQARAKLTAGDVAGAEELFQRAVDVTPEMAHQVIRALEAEGVGFVVAPYEADAQLALLARLPEDDGGLTAVVSEDSDLLAYGCDAVIYKMDKFGNAEEVGLGRLFAEGSKKTNTDLSFRNFTHDLFLAVCVLSGCDFLPSLPGIGVKRAHALVAKFRNVSRVLTRLKFDGKGSVPAEYASDFWRARATFLHARVYDPKSRELRYLTPLPADFEEKLGEDTSFLGPPLAPWAAQGIAEGRLNPFSLEPLGQPEDATWQSQATPGRPCGPRQEGQRLPGRRQPAQQPVSDWPREACEGEPTQEEDEDRFFRRRSGMGDASALGSQTLLPQKGLDRPVPRPIPLALADLCKLASLTPADDEDAMDANLSLSPRMPLGDVSPNRKLPRGRFVSSLPRDNISRSPANRSPSVVSGNPFKKAKLSQM